MSVNLLLGCSYNVRKDLINQVITKRQKEISKNRKFFGDYFWRGEGKYSEFMKYNFLLNGVPIFVYGAISAIKSPEIKDVVIVGNSKTGEFTKVLQEQFKSYLKQNDKNLVFVHEGENNGYPLENTLKKGQKILGNKQSMFLTGDTPLVDVDETITSLPIKEEDDIIINLNGFNNINQEFSTKYSEGVFPRYYHLDFKFEDGTLEPVKESNIYMLKLEDNVIRVADKFFGMRKGITTELIEYFKEDIFKRPIKEQGAVFSNAPYLGTQLLRYVLGFKPQIKSENAQKLARDLEGVIFNISPEHKAPGNLEDADSLQDYMFLQESFIKAPHIYPYAKEVAEFKDRMKNSEKEEFVLMMNTFTRDIGYADIFDSEGNFKKGFLYELFPQYTEERNEDHIKLHTFKKAS